MTRLIRERTRRKPINPHWKCTYLKRYYSLVREETKTKMFVEKDRLFFIKKKYIRKKDHQPIWPHKKLNKATHTKMPTRGGPREEARGKGVYHGSTQKVLPLQTIMLLPQMPERKRGNEKMINREREEWGRKRMAEERRW